MNNNNMVSAMKREEPIKDFKIIQKLKAMNRKQRRLFFRENLDIVSFEHILFESVHERIDTVCDTAKTKVAGTVDTIIVNEQQRITQAVKEVLCENLRFGMDGSRMNKFIDEVNTKLERKE